MSHRPVFPMTALCATTAWAAQVPARTDSSLQHLGVMVQAAGATIYTAREVITLDPKKPRAEAIAVRGGTFIAVGRAPRSPPRPARMPGWTRR